jgi:hypothetical protein
MVKSKCWSGAGGGGTSFGFTTGSVNQRSRRNTNDDDGGLRNTLLGKYEKPTSSGGGGGALLGGGGGGSHPFQPASLDVSLFMGCTGTFGDNSSDLVAYGVQRAGVGRWTAAAERSTNATARMPRGMQW